MDTLVFTITSVRCGLWGSVHKLVFLVGAIIFLVQRSHALESNLIDPAPRYSDGTTPCGSWLPPPFRDDLTRFFLINTQEDINNLLNCKNITRQVKIFPNADQTTLNLSGIESFDYGLTIQGSSSVTRIIAQDLVKIFWNFTISDLPNLELLEIPKLRDVQYLSLVNLPKLSSLSGTDVIIPLAIGNTDSFGKNDSVLITSTGLEAVEFVKKQPYYVSDGCIIISNNTNLASVVFEELQAIGSSGHINITNNHPNLTVSLPNLVGAKNVTIMHVEEVLLPNLQTVDSLSFEHNNFQSLSLPALQYVWDSLKISENNYVRKVDLPNIITVGMYFEDNSHNKLRIDHNMALTVLKFAGGLNVNGNTKLIGNFSSIDFGGTVPLELKDGELLIASQNPDFDCKPYNKAVLEMFPEEDRDALSRKYSCGIGQPGVPGYRTIELSSVGSKSKLSMKDTIAVVVVSSICLILGIIVAFRYYRRRKLKIKAADLRNQEGNANSQWIELEGNERTVRGRTADGVMRESEEVDRLPAYEKIGKPEEVPPAYLGVVHSDIVDDGSSGISTVIPSGTATPSQHMLEAGTPAGPRTSDRA